MAVKKGNPIPEFNPPAGGSYVRQPDTGELVQTEGPGMQPAAAAPDLPAATAKPNTNLQE